MVIEIALINPIFPQLSMIVPLICCEPEVKVDT